jgi:hypothetical protein
MADDNYTIISIPVFAEQQQDDPVLVLKSQRVIQHPGLIQYLDKRGIDIKLGRRLCKIALFRTMLILRHIILNFQTSAL